MAGIGGLDALKLALATQGVTPEVLDKLVEAAFKFGEDSVALMHAAIEEKRARIIALKADAAARLRGMSHAAAGVLADRILAEIKADLDGEETDPDEPEKEGLDLDSAPGGEDTTPTA